MTIQILEVISYQVFMTIDSRDHVDESIGGFNAASESRTKNKPSADK